MKTRTLAVIAIGLWVVTLAVGVILFIRGRTVPSQDGRRAIVLAPAQRDLILAEMRGMLGSVQGIVHGLSQNDMKQVARAARASGMAAAADVSPALMARLPLAFKTLGLSVHRGFDELAAQADAGATRAQILARLDAQLSSCVGCHAGYRLQTEAPAAH